MTGYNDVPRKAPASTAGQLTAIEHRLARIESRVVQMMIHLGLDPYKQTYEASPTSPVKRVKPQ